MWELPVACVDIYGIQRQVLVDVADFWADVCTTSSCWGVVLSSTLPSNLHVVLLQPACV